jgi:hypothetical protein
VNEWGIYWVEDYTALRLLIEVLRTRPTTLVGRHTGLRERERARRLWSGGALAFEELL